MASTATASTKPAERHLTSVGADDKDTLAKVQKARQSLGLEDAPPPITGEFLQESQIDILVDDCQSTGVAMNKTLTFRVKGSTTLPTFNKSFSVRRSFPDFVWLERTLIAKFPFHAIPTVGKKNRQFNFNAGGETREFAKRSIAMNRFLNRIASHPVLAKASPLRNFLELDEVDFKAFKATTDTQISVGKSAVDVGKSAKMPGRKELSGDPEDQRLQQTKSQLEQMRKTIGIIKSASVSIIQKANIHAEEQLGLANAFSGLIGEFPNSDVMKIFATSQHTDGAELFNIAHSDRFETYEMMKSWQLSLDSTAELLDRFEAAKERSELVKRLYEQKKEKIQTSKTQSESAIAELQKVQRAMRDAEDMVEKHRAWMWKEMQRFEDYSKQERLHWARYFAEQRIHSYRKRINAWKSFLESANNYESEEMRRVQEAEFAKNLNKTSVFRLPLSVIMENQKATHPNLKIPYILQFLTEIILESGGLEVVGIFRKSVESDLLASTKYALEKGDYNTIMREPILAACLIKTWLKGIKEPLLPVKFYQASMACANADGTSKGFIKYLFVGSNLQKLIDQFPSENREVICFLISFLRRIAANEPVNKMSSLNLAIVISPNFCRCPDINQILINTKFETQFINSLITKLPLADSIGAVPGARLAPLANPVRKVSNRKFAATPVPVESRQGPASIPKTAFMTAPPPSASSPGSTPTQRPGLTLGSAANAATASSGSNTPLSPRGGNMAPQPQSQPQPQPAAQAQVPGTRNGTMRREDSNPSTSTSTSSPSPSPNPTPTPTSNPNPNPNPNPNGAAMVTSSGSVRTRHNAVASPGAGAPSHTRTADSSRAHLAQSPSGSLNSTSTDITFSAQPMTQTQPSRGQQGQGPSVAVSSSTTSSTASAGGVSPSAALYRVNALGNSKPKNEMELALVKDREYDVFAVDEAGHWYQALDLVSNKKGWIPVSWCSALRPRDPTTAVESGFESVDPNVEPDESTSSALDEIERQLYGDILANI